MKTDKKAFSVLNIGKARRVATGHHSTKPLEGNAVKFSVHRVGHEDYRRLDTILSYDLVKHAGLKTGDRVDVQFNAAFTEATIRKAGPNEPATRLQKRRETSHPHGLIAVRIPVTEPVQVHCVEAEILDAKLNAGSVRVSVPAELRDKLRGATDVPGAAA
jgi:hypothetical protein